MSSGGSPSRAVDGNKNQDHFQHSCIHTEGGFNNWLQIDLQKLAKVARVTIYNRMDCCNWRTNSVDIHTATSANMVENRKLCVYFHTITAGNGIGTFNCGGNNKGRYVRLTLKTNDILNICEFEIYGYFLN